MMRFLKWCARPFAEADDAEIGALALLLALAIIALVLIAARIEAMFTIFDMLNRGMK